MKGSRMNLSFGPEIIFDDAEFQLGDRDKAGIVGVNGAGKTTLFRLLRGEIALDGGTLSVGRARVGYLPQEIVFDRENETVWSISPPAVRCRKSKPNWKKFTGGWKPRRKPNMNGCLSVWLICRNNWIILTSMRPMTFCSR